MRLKHYLYIVSIVALAACTSEELTPSDAVGEEIRLSAGTVSGNSSVATRGDVSDKAFTVNTAIALQVSGTWTGHSSEIVTLPTTATPSASNNSNLSLSPALYWDDYGSADPANAETGRKEGLTIYGVAADGETTAPAVTDWTKLVWDLGADQTSGISAKDLLISNNVKGDNTYRFESRADGKQLKFHHVLSKITVNLKADEGFTDNKFASDPVVVLTSNEANSTANTEWAYSSGTFNVTTGEIDKSSLTRNAVTMYQAVTAATGYTVTKEALVMPGSTFNNDAATIMSINADGNIYYITAKQIRTAISSTLATDEAYALVAGKNYIFNVKVKKTGVTVTATVKDWETVDSGEETPEIIFTNDVSKVSDGSGISLSKDDTFTLWKSSGLTAADFDKAEQRTITYDGSTYACNPKLYWQSASDDSYFRALATMTTTATTTTIAAVTDAVATNKDAKQGTDLLWGTTAAHTGTYTGGSKDYDEGAAINPRTGEVPLVFKHAMSNVVIKLKTADKDTDPDYINLTGANVKFVKLAKSGSIDIANGKVSASSTLDDLAFEKTVDTEYKVTEFMVPQTLTSDAQLVITVADGTTNGTKYSLKLSDCTLENSTTAISEWESGKQYTYTITLKKEAVLFRVMVQEWIPTKGSGNATLDWD